MADTGWSSCARSLKGVILDMCGVLYDSGEGDGVAIPGSIEAVRKLKASDLKLRFCTNETQASRDKFVAKLQRLGFDISVEEVFSPAPAAVAVLKQRGLRPHLLVHDALLPEFAGVDKSDPNCVVIGDAADNFSYQNLNEAFRVLIGLEKPVLFSLGRGKYYKEMDGLSLDVGVYMKALEYATDAEAEVIGKPATSFFQSVLNDMVLQSHEVMMIGDDLVNDVGGAQQCGMKGVQVRTGKYRPSDEKHPTVTADGTVDDLAQAVDMILGQRC
uniref:phospholysine phosphohistidine inorganic pyrophosphate phosphatase n=1 Tax=Doryrhamphus excisus TaxID=161450 RepID=UPI0025AE017C|nr:phospholysine phosphohistidine inorganic pyrophosphate phosphatase [Doryrhamphus excisus]XP_057918712.1 phospholysine phosphohistidine inorganic pyrophosphate phosphatase [Doryrhamphus excisus]XP_057918713.1 phospholysine phosphohistidine inorganic pyrophosphate phosphatase [Doryrhamphus excisus]